MFTVYCIWVPTGTVPISLLGSARYSTLSWMENEVSGPIPMTPFCSPVTGMECASFSYLKISIFRLPGKKSRGPSVCLTNNY